MASRVRLLGEDLVAFRDTRGAVGLMAANCPHRGASLFFGRNEECGLRCVYHGWKFDVTGGCVDMPSEPAESTFKDKVRARAYPCHEVNGVIWAYMGPRETPPSFPPFEITTLPADHVYPPLMMLEECKCGRRSRATSTPPTSTGCTARCAPSTQRGTWHRDKRPRPTCSRPTTAHATRPGATGRGGHLWHRITQFMRRASP